jgi:NADPH:quinone reductase-like Zn-dependent oxidoreductase
MQALRAHRRGGPEQLVYEPAPRPPLGIGDVLLEVHAASFIPTELDWPSTWSDRLGRDRTPVIPPTRSAGWSPPSVMGPAAWPLVTRCLA